MDEADAAMATLVALGAWAAAAMGEADAATATWVASGQECPRTKMAAPVAQATKQGVGPMERM